MYQSSVLQRFLIFSVAILLGAVGTSTAAEPPVNPILRIEVGANTGIINCISTDAQGRFLATSSDDKTARLFDVGTGRLVNTFRPPIGEGNEGKLFAVAISPDGSTLAVGGWTGTDWGDTAIYLFDTSSGKLLRRIGKLPNTTITHLIFSVDGRTFAAGLGGENGIRIFRSSDGSEIARDIEYGGASYSVHFAADGRVVSSCEDGYIRLYAYDDKSLRLVAKTRPSGGSVPGAARFSPNGARIAVGYNDSRKVDILSSVDLFHLFSADTSGVDNGNLQNVAWSADGLSLYAGGMYRKYKANHVYQNFVRRWDSEGKSKGVDIPVGVTDTIFSFASLPSGGLLVATADSKITLLEEKGQRRLLSKPPIANYREGKYSFQIAPDGSEVRFGYEEEGLFPYLFDLPKRILAPLDMLQAMTMLSLPTISLPSITIEGWNGTTTPRFNGVPLKLEQGERSDFLAINPDGSGFLLGASWSLRYFTRSGEQLWKMSAPSSIYGVNIVPTGRVAVVAYGDGTIKWHRLSDGKELVTLFPHADRKRWVLWTPEGFFDHSPGGEELIGFHLNRGKDREAEFIPISKLYGDFYRPDLVAASFEGKDISEYAKAIDINKILSAKSLPPKVRITTKASSTDKPEAEVSAEICDDGGGIGDVTLYLNNMPIAVESGGRGLRVVGKKAASQCFSFTRNLTLDNGDNVISLMVYNRENSIESDRSSITIKHSSRFIGKPNLYILTIAVDKYRDGDLHLKYSNADANGVAELLNNKGKGLFGSITRRTLKDAEVTKERLEETFTAIGKKIRREDMFILFVAGHGITYSKDGAFYYLPVNFRYSQDEDIPKSGVSMNDFKRYLAYIQASKSLLLLDTCNSGSFAEAIASRGVLEKTAINKLTRAVGRHTIVASSKSQVALEGYQGHGAFSWILLDGMKGKAANPKGQITVNSLVSYVETALPELTYKKWGYEQIPQKSLVGEDFTIGLK